MRRQGPNGTDEVGEGALVVLGTAACLAAAFWGEYLMAEKISTRVERLENLVGVLAERQAKLDDVLILLTEAQIKTEERFQEVGQRFQEVGRRFQETEQRFQETDRRFRDLDERIGKLVSAIGELVRRTGTK